MHVIDDATYQEGSTCLTNDMRLTTGVYGMRPGNCTHSLASATFMQAEVPHSLPDLMAVSVALCLCWLSRYSPLTFFSSCTTLWTFLWCASLRVVRSVGPWEYPVSRYLIPIQTRPNSDVMSLCCYGYWPSVVAESLRDTSAVARQSLVFWFYQLHILRYLCFFIMC